MGNLTMLAEEYRMDWLFVYHFISSRNRVFFSHYSSADFTGKLN